MIYVIGSLENPKVPQIANELREHGLDAWDSWWAASRLADTNWQRWAQGRGFDYITALQDRYAEHVYQFDLEHLEKASSGLLITPAGKSGHLELGWLLGRGKPGYILLDVLSEKWDIMYKFATGISYTVEELLQKAVDLR